MEERACSLSKGHESVGGDETGCWHGLKACASPQCAPERPLALASVAFGAAAS